MKNKPTYNLDDDLLRKYLSGDLSAKQSKGLNQILESDPTVKHYLEQMDKIWKTSGRIGEIEKIELEGDWKAIQQKAETRSMASSGNLNLSENLNSAGSPASTKTQVSTRTLAFRFVRIAAIFILVSLAAYMLYYYTGNGAMSKMDWITVVSTNAQQEITLSDGSRISLNSGSSLVYPASFKGKKRLVELEGEAFFDIARDAGRPFLINIASEAEAEVLGTSFNLRQDPKNRKVFLNVVTGKVAFYAKGKKKEAEIVEQEEQAVYENGSVRQKANFNLNFLSWKTRTLEFENTPLPEVVEQIGRHYRTEIHIVDDKLDTLALTGIYKNQSIDEVIEEIGLVLDLEFRKEGSTINVSGIEFDINAE